MSAIQAILSSAAGAVVCNSSCRRSFLKASHFMSDAYAWFGAAYFIYDMWHMYRSYASKIADKILLIDRNTNKCNGRCRSNENNNLSPCIDCMDKYGVHLSHAEIADRFKDISSQPINFLQFCSLHPVMIIHHIFLGSFGLLVIVVSKFYVFRRQNINHKFCFSIFSIYEAISVIVCTVLCI